MTEDRAKTKWCFAARVGSTASGLGSINRDAHPDGIIRKGELPQESMCIGSECMAWRENIINRATVPADGTCDEKLPYSQGWRIIRSLDPAGSSPQLMLKQVTGGYCGLVGPDE